MSFGTGYLDDPQVANGGELYGNNHTILSAEKGSWENGLKIGRFAIVKSNVVSNADGSATPVIAGVPLRDPSNPMENGDTLTAATRSHAEFARDGLLSVNVKSGESAPSYLGSVYMSNAGDANDGLATSTNTDVLTQAEFIRAETDGVWLVNLKTPVNA